MGFDPGTILIRRDGYIYDIVAVEEESFCFFAFSLSLFIPYFSHVFKHHIKEVIEASQNACEFSFALHYYPQSFPDAFVEERQRHYLN
jgi:hypothetical protein